MSDFELVLFLLLTIKIIISVPEYSHVVVKSTVPNDNLFTLENLLAVCRLDAKMRAVPEMSPICETSSDRNCCASWSLPNYVALLSNRSSCLEITVSFYF